MMNLTAYEETYGDEIARDMHPEISSLTISDLVGELLNAGHPGPRTPFVVIAHAMRMVAQGANHESMADALSIVQDAMGPDGGINEWAIEEVLLSL
jgi:hypothetical protein